MKGRKGANLLSVVIPVASGIILNRKIEPITHELNVTMNGLGADFQLTRQTGGIGVAS
jgi:hypothetical protein